MSSTLSNIVWFTAGATVSFVVAWKVLESRFERITQEEIKDVKERFSRRLKEMSDEKIYESLAAEYTGKQNEKKEVKEIEPEEDYIRIISPDEYGENGDEYDLMSYTYYADGVLADEMDEPIEDIESVIGSEALNTFGDYDPNSVFVRNDRHRCDYEILRDTRKYSEVKKLYIPHKTED